MAHYKLTGETKMTVEDVAEVMLNLMAEGKADQIVICQGEDMGWDNIKEYTIAV
tara:strand:- start:774 stop:935 length:162 start_codon:yes stop_codon:yes gene_type:complete